MKRVNTFCIARNNTYKDERWCGHCEKDTKQECFDSGHERDSSGDWQICLECGWKYSGLSGTWDPPVDLSNLEE